LAQLITNIKHFTFFLAILISGLCQAQDTTKVLFIGNSFTSQNNLPALFSELGQGSGNNVVVAFHMSGGISVGDITQGTYARMNNPYVYSLIKTMIGTIWYCRIIRTGFA
jgi:hypothetical protein